MTPVWIEKLVYGGDGLGRLESGEVVFVPWSAPGDQLQLDIQNTKPKRGVIQNILTPAPLRTDPPCSVFGTCGGCQWQHVGYSAQAEWKQTIVTESLQRIGKIQNPPVQPTITAEPWHYRNNIQWKVQHTPQGTQIGYFQGQTHTVIPFEHCWIIPEALTPLAHWLEQHLPPAAHVMEINVRTNAAQEILLILEGNELKLEPLEALSEICTQEFPAIIGVLARTPEGITPLAGRAYLIETLGSSTFQVSAESFFQTHRAVAEKLLDVMGQWLPEKAESLIDLYAGVGTFALAFEDRAPLITAIESVPSAVRDAQANFARHQVYHIQLLEGDVSQILPKLETFYEVAILDPPRAGCTPAVLEWVNQSVTGQMLYVSCDPTTLARDLKQLIAAGWQLEVVQPFDMFPQTYHVETLCALRR